MISEFQRSFHRQFHSLIAFTSDRKVRQCSNTRFPLLQKKFHDFSRIPEAFFQDPVVSQRYINIETNSSCQPYIYIYIYSMIAASILEYMFITVTCCNLNTFYNYSASIIASASLPSKFQDLGLRFPKLSRSWEFYRHNDRTFQAWEPWQYDKFVAIFIIC